MVEAAFENAGPQDAFLNLGFMMGNGRTTTGAERLEPGRNRSVSGHFAQLIDGVGVLALTPWKRASWRLVRSRQA